MSTDLSAEQIKTLHKRHRILTAQMREALARLADIDEAIETKQLPAQTSFDDIGTPIKERP